MITPGATVGPYTIDRELGRGGMGVVYAGHDPRLDRAVAIKALPPEFSSDPVLKNRFEREARSLAALSHPNIATVYGVEDQNGSRFLVMELVEGETLSAKLSRGRLPVPDALSIAAEVAAAVEAAHDRAVIHRDIKPGNVMVAPGGGVKVLDFGLARDSTPTTDHSATVRATPMTAEGKAVGTPGYMSPEQCRAKPVDRRTDIFSLGCVLYECLTGQMAFGGETPSDAIAACLEREPDWSKLPERTPPTVRGLLRRCLEKDPRRRLRDIGDARLELEEAIAARAWTTTGFHAAAGGPRRAVWPWIGAGAVVAAAGIGLWGAGVLRRPASALPAAPMARLSIALPADPRVSDQFTVSPDGRTLAYIATPVTPSGPPRVYVRTLDSFDATPLAGTEGAYNVTISPDGKWVAFATRVSETGARTAIMKVQLAGGPPITLYEQASDSPLRMPQWIDAGAVAFEMGPSARQIGVVSADGGTPTTIWEAAKAGFTERVQSIAPVPGSKYLLMTQPVLDAKGWREETMLLNRASGEFKVLLERGAYAMYARGCVLYTHDNALMARPFDPDRGEFTGGALPLVSGLRAPQSYSSYLWGLATEAGTLFYVPGGNLSSKRRLALVDLQGKIEPLSKVTAEFEDSVAMSPDGKLACGAIVSESGTYELFVYDVATDSVRRLPTPGDCVTPVWTPDSRRVVYGVRSNQAPAVLVLRRIEGGDTLETLTQAKVTGEILRPTSVSPDGKWVACNRWSQAEGGTDIQLVSLEGPHEVRPLFKEAGSQANARFSPDGVWIAYNAEAMGRRQLVIRASPLVSGQEDSRILVSANCEDSLWSPDGSVITYVEGRGRIKAVDAKLGPPLTISRPRDILNGEELGGASDFVSFTPDSKHIIFIQKGDEEARIGQLNVVLNWYQELQAKLPTRMR
jgi:serine/threonine-protein kinase